MPQYNIYWDTASGLFVRLQICIVVAIFFEMFGEINCSVSFVSCTPYSTNGAPTPTPVNGNAPAISLKYKAQFLTFDFVHCTL